MAPSRWALLLFAASVGAACDRFELDQPDVNVVRPASPEREQAVPPGAIYRRSFAVVIGIDAYVNLDRLGGAVRDARAMARSLGAQGFQVTSILDGDATQQHIREVLGDRLRQQLEHDDRVLIYFAGHGVSVGDAGAETGYLMPVGAKSYSPVATGISMTELGLWFDAYPSKHVMFLADACYSGLALATRSMALVPDSRGYLQEIARRRVRYTLVAGDATQEAHEWDNQGVFTRFVLEAMSGGADANRDNLVTSDELANYVKPRVSDLVHARFQAAQLPLSARSGTGEFVFYLDADASEQVAARPARGPAPEPPTAAGHLPSGVTPIEVQLNVIGVWKGPDGYELRIQREGKKTIVIGTEPEGRYVLGMIEKSEGAARFEGAGRVLGGEGRGRFFQLDGRLTAQGAYTAELRATRQVLDNFGLPVGPPSTDAPVQYRWQPSPVHRGPNLPVEGDWEGGEERRASIRAEGDAAVITCTDRWGRFEARSRHWADDEVVFEGTGAFAKDGRPFRIAARLSQRAPDVLDYEPVIQYLDGAGVPIGASLLGYTWTLRRRVPGAAPLAPSGELLAAPP